MGAQVFVDEVFSCQVSRNAEKKNRRSAEIS